MDNKTLQTYTARISQANKSELLLITYELYFEYTKEARECFALENKIHFEEYASKAQKFVLELMETLNYAYPVSKDLFVLYIYVNKMLIRAMMKHQLEPLDEADKIMKMIMDGYSQIKQIDKSGAVMTNTQTIYAGLTYGRGDLVEVCESSNISGRGFIA